MFFFRLSSIEISKEIFFLLPVLDILEKRKFFFFPFIFDRNFGKKENFFFSSIFDENFEERKTFFFDVYFR